MPKQKLIALYMPVLHRGYMEFFDTFPEADTAYVFGSDILENIDYLRKDLRALNPDQQHEVLNGLNRFKSVQIIDQRVLKAMDLPDNSFVFPDEDVSRAAANKLKRADKTLYPIFLRWDRRSVEGIDKQEDSIAISDKKFEQDFMAKAMESAGQSSDIWRRVGAVLVANGGKAVETASNRGEPTPNTPWIEGDPRNIFNRGVGIEMSIFTHAEANLIAEAAKRGLKLEGAELFVTTFPCPACAKLIAHSGIKTCYFKDGYAVLDGKRVMEDYGVKLVRVQMLDEETENPAVWVPYNKNKG